MINRNYWYHLTNNWAKPDPARQPDIYKVLDGYPGARMTLLLDRGQRSSQLWRFELVDGSDIFRIHNRAAGDLVSLECVANSEIIALRPNSDAAGQKWRITPHENGLLAHYRLHNLGVNKALDSSRDAPTLGGWQTSPGQNWRFNPMATLGDLETPPYDMNVNPFDQYVGAQGVHVLGTKFVSTWAMLQVQEIIDHVVLSIRDPARREAFAGRLTIVMNWCDMPDGPATCYGEPIGRYDCTDDLILNEYRGGTNNRRTWVTEEMMCTVGVRSRDKGKPEAQMDRTYRQYDQIVHEWGHLVDRVLGLDAAAVFSRAGFPIPGEQFAWCTEAWFNNRFCDDPDATQTRESLKKMDLKNGLTAYDFLAQTFDPDCKFYPTTLYHKLFV